MASTYTVAGIELITQGEQAGAWGDTTNTNWELIEEMVGGVASVALSTTSETLSVTDGASSDARHAAVVFTGSPGGTCTVTVSPNDMQKIYFIVNNSDQTVAMSQGSGANVSIPAGSKKIVYCDGAGAGAAVVDLTTNLDISGLHLGGTEVTATAAELNYVSGVTSSVQTQLDAMVEKAGDTMTGFLTLHADPTSNLHAATKAYVDEVAQGVALKPAADAASTANISGTYNNGTAGVGSTMTFAAAASFTVDGVTFDTVGQGLLLKDQTAAEENGRYYLSTVGDAGTSWVFTRCIYCDTADEIPGGYIFVQGGTTNAGTGWVMTVADAETFVVGTDDITVIQFSGAGTYTAGTGLDLTGTVFSHTDTSSQASVNNSGNTFIQDVTLDDFGHVTALTSATAVINDGTLSMGVSGTGLSGSASFTANDSDNVTFTVTSNATSANTVSTIVARDGSGNFSAGTITASLTGAVTGNASTATALQTARTIGGVSFDGTANINLPGVNTAGNQSTSGNAATATKLATARTISLTGDVTGSASFDGSANASITATVADDSHNHTIANVDGLQTALDGKQPLDADLTAIAALANTDGNFIVGNGTAWVAESGATARTSLGLGGLATLSAVGASEITDNSVGAAELNVSGDGTTSQFLRSDGDGTFTWATPTDTDTTYSAGTGISLVGTTFSNSGVTSNVAGAGIDVSAATGAVTISVESDLRGDVTQIGQDTNDYFAVGTTTHDWYLDGNLDMRLENDGDLHVDGDVIAYSTTTSDPRLKDNIQKVEGALEKVEKLTGYTFTYKVDGRESAGVMSTEVREVLPSAVRSTTLPLKSPNGEDDQTEYDVVQYDQLHALLIEAVKELSARVESLEAKLG
jgi:hypothetical protein